MANEHVLYDLVVVGSSAGGIEALSTLVATLPADFPAPIVVAQHLDPDRPSRLGDILGRRSTLPVRTVTDAEPQPLVTGVVYVVPSDRDVEITDHAVSLRADSAPSTRHPKPSINLLLSSAARAHGERLLAVILTGTGTDGAMGAREVKAAGGTVVIENPRTAAFPSMPASLAPTSVDMVADLDQIGPLLYGLLVGASVPAQPTQPDQVDTVQALLEQVRAHSGIEFANYKRPTILRRLQRRLAATGTTTLPDYLRFLTAHPEEYQRLIGSFLINVTEFFRDPELFRVLREQVLPELVAQARTQGHELRIWSAGCATGEEAYSLAILVAEALGTELEQVAVRIFATDLDADAVAFARRGVYPAAALTAVPDELIARHFLKRDGEYEVEKRVRALTIFGEHDLGQRAPFPRIDLVLCRNVLIYFTPELQRRALQVFAYSLRDGGYLVLGKSETTGPLAELFAPVHPHLKLYRRQGQRVVVPAPRVNTVLPPLSIAALSERRPPVAPPVAPLTTPLPALVHASPAAQRARTAREQLGDLVLGLSIGVVVVNRRYDVQAINAAAHRLLGIFHPAVGEDLIHLAASVSSAALRSTIDAAFRTTTLPAVEQVLTIETTLGEQRDLQIVCYPQGGEVQAELVEYVVLLVTDVTSVMEARRAAEEAAARAQRERETARTRDTRERQRAHTSGRTPASGARKRRRSGGCTKRSRG